MIFWDSIGVFFGKGIEKKSWDSNKLVGAES
jgi:hypothetical protein